MYLGIGEQRRHQECDQGEGTEDAEDPGQLIARGGLLVARQDQRGGSPLKARQQQGHDRGDAKGDAVDTHIREGARFSLAPFVLGRGRELWVLWGGLGAGL